MSGFGGSGFGSGFPATGGGSLQSPFGSPPAAGPFGSGAVNASSTPAAGTAVPSFVGAGASNPFQSPPTALNPSSSHSHYNNTSTSFGSSSQNNGSSSNPFAGSFNHGNTAINSSNPFSTPTSFGQSSTFAPPATAPISSAFAPVATPAPATQPAATSTYPFGTSGNSSNAAAATTHIFGASASQSDPFAPSTSAGLSSASPGAPLVFGKAKSSPDTNASSRGNNSSTRSDNNPFGQSASSPAPPNTASVGPFAQVAPSSTPRTASSSTTMVSMGPFGQAAPSSMPATTTSMGPFGQAGSSSMPAAAPITSLGPFGQAPALWDHSSRSNNTKSNKARAPPRVDLPFGTPAPQSQPQSGGDPPQSNDSEEDQKRRLAIIEKKKKKLEELKRKKEKAVTVSSQISGTVSHSPMPSSSVPSSSQAPSNPLPSSITAAGSSLAQRNAARFDQSASNATTRAHLPADLQAKAGQAVDYAALRATGGGGDRGDLHQAKSLVGTCPHMCPDEELLRREREGDIQLLEMVEPDGKLHPQDWTLRNTVIKRFRRSAADYKLDVPEWVRPPDVLENVCAYLEEWIMERDRQGADPRFKGAVPPPLDVYQFIWDRTRMIRKDFTLQNYVGTGGNCDARAVRCHERIARWHAMCEHQLSHITDFVAMQSQQNVQELGQTMKTLNQFYDDALKRSRVEVPDELGRETRRDLRGFCHGCANDTVQGESPTDYNGAALANNGDSSIRLVGKQGLEQFHHGTAEPEMRGLYILLTIDNDGGMEVMRYAAHLSRERPEIFESVPVQLALKVYKAKKEDNYANFFRILRSSSTPYLFACVMFKYVPQMRKEAFKKMSKTYGGRIRDSSEALYDQYPLRDLVRMLCFEDEEEAVSACKHFNICVKETNTKSSSGKITKINVIFWRGSDFAEPKDPDRGTPIPLKPKKMMSTIEAKRNGATRLAVCRGDVSGVGAFLQGDSNQDKNSRLSNVADIARQQALALAAMKDYEDAKKKRQEEAARLAQEHQKQAEEKSRRAKDEEQKRRKAQLLIDQRKAVEEEHRRKMEEKRTHAEAERLAAVEAKQKAEEQQRLARIAAEREQQRRIDEARKEDQRRRIEAEQLAAKKAAKAKCEELARIQEVERKAREAEERRLGKEWNDKVAHCRIVLALKRWKCRVPRSVELRDATLTSIDHMKHLSALSGPLGSRSMARGGRRRHSSGVGDLRSVVESLIRSRRRLEIGFACLNRSADTRIVQATGQQAPHLIKIACFFPESENRAYSNLCTLVHRFIDERLGFGSIRTGSVGTCETRLAFVDGSIPEGRMACDGVLVIVPSGTSDIPLDAIDGIGDTIGSIPRTGLILSQNPKAIDENRRLHQALSPGAPNKIELVSNAVVSEEAIENALTLSVETIMQETFSRPLPSIECTSLEHLGMLCVNRTLWLDSVLESRDGLLDCVKSVLAVLADELNEYGSGGVHSWRWPSREFLSDQGVVQDYFGKDRHLPADWHKSLLRDNVLLPLQEMAFRLNGTFPHVVLYKLLAEAPDEMVKECRELFERRMFRRCLQRAIMWRHENPEPWQTPTFVYLPKGMAEILVHRCIDSISMQVADEINDSNESDNDGVDTIFASSENEENIQIPSVTAEASSGGWVNDGADNSLISSSQSRQSKPLCEEHDLATSSPLGKRKTTAGTATADLETTRPTKRLRDSRAYTQRLRALAAGNLVPPVFIGTQSLSFLLQNAPPPLDPQAAEENY